MGMIAFVSSACVPLVLCFLSLFLLPIFHTCISTSMAPISEVALLGDGSLLVLLFLHLSLLPISPYLCIHLHGPGFRSGTAGRRLICAGIIGCTASPQSFVHIAGLLLEERLHCLDGATACIWVGVLWGGKTYV